MNPRSPIRWATDISSVLNTVLGADHFPIKVAEIAKDYSHQVFPKDPILKIHGEAFSKFDGALLRVRDGKDGWGILYNSAIRSQGRINFTLAHEFGHYLIHRTTHPEGIRCGQQDVVRWDDTYRQTERQANQFAAYLLMPFDDYRRQIEPRRGVDLDALAHCADRYQVSLIAATLRWLEYTERRAVLVVSRDGFVLWSRSSKLARKTGAYINTSGTPVEVPDGSFASKPPANGSARAVRDLDAGVWFLEPCREMAIASENYDFTITLLELPSASKSIGFGEDEEEAVALNDVIRRNHGL